MTAFLLDTHLLLWTVKGDARLTPAARALIADPAHRIAFSVASVWEIAIKAAGRRDDFNLDPLVVRNSLLARDFEEVAITAESAVAAAQLPPLHRDPFDRMLVAQSIQEGLTLLTADRTLARYPGPIRLVT